LEGYDEEEEEAYWEEENEVPEVLDDEQEGALIDRKIFQD
jgi:hypothetical protein